MRVLHFYKTFYPESYGGVERVIFELCNHFSSIGMQIDVLSLSPKNESHSVQFRGYKAHKSHQNFELASTGFSFSVVSQFKKLATTADLIHYHFPWPFMDFVHFAANLKKPTLVTYHSDIVRQKKLLNLYRPLRNIFLDSVDSIVATSPNYLKSSDILQHYKNKVEIIPIGLDRSLYQPSNAERSQYWREILGSKFFLFIGMLRYYKGLNILLDALALKDFPMVIIGAGPIESELKSKAASLDLKNIIFLGQVSEEDKAEILNLSYAIVFPSHLRSEAFGISLLEGAMFGKPMISSEIGTGTSYINLDQETGIVVPPSSPKDLHFAMTYLWNNPDAAEKMGIAAIARYEKLFTVDRMCKSYFDLYQRLVHKKQSSTK